jgi:hypothetical protein
MLELPLADAVCGGFPGGPEVPGQSETQAKE